MTDAPLSQGELVERMRRCASRLDILECEIVQQGADAISALEKENGRLSNELNVTQMSDMTGREMVGTLRAQLTEAKEEILHQEEQLKIADDTNFKHSDANRKLTEENERLKEDNAQMIEKAERENAKLRKFADEWAEGLPGQATDNGLREDVKAFRAALKQSEGK